MPTDDLFGLIGAGKVKHGLQAAVVEGCTGDRHGACFQVTAWVTGRVPRHVTKQGASGEHPVKPVDQVHSSSSSARREELQ